MGQGEQVPATLNGRSTGGPVVATEGTVSASRTPLVMSDSTAEFIPPPFSDSPPSPDVLSEEALEQLSAHLDGELSDEEDRRVLDLLARHPQARLERRRFQEAWNLLDWLPRPHADAEFATRTLSRIHALDSLGDSATSSAHPAPSLGQIGSRFGTVLESTVRQGATNQARRQDMNRKRAWLLWPVALLVFLSVALISSGRLTHPADRLVRELEFVEWLDEYQAIQTVEQFQAMETLAPWDSLIGQAEPIGRAVFSDADALWVSDQSETNATDQGWARLNAMPRAVRLELAARLTAFDSAALDSQRRWRRMDQWRRNLPPERRRRLEAVTRCYVAWREALGADDRARLDNLAQTDLDAWRAEIVQWHGHDLQERLTSERPRPFTPLDPSRLIRDHFDAAWFAPTLLWIALELWNDLSPDERARITANAADPSVVLNRLLEDAARRGIIVEPVESGEARWNEVIRNRLLNLAAPPNLGLGGLRNRPRLAAIPARILLIRLNDADLDWRRPPFELPADHAAALLERLPEWVHAELDLRSPNQARRMLAALAERLKESDTLKNMVEFEASEPSSHPYQFSDGKVSI